MTLLILALKVIYDIQIPCIIIVFLKGWVFYSGGDCIMWSRALLCYETCRQNVPSWFGFKLAAKCPFVFGIQAVGKMSLRVLDSSWRQSVPLCLGFKLSAKCPFVFWIQAGGKVSLCVWDSSCRQNVPSCFGFKLAAKCPFVFGIQVVGKVPLRVWDSSCRQSAPSCLGFKLSAKFPIVFGIQAVGKVSLSCLGFKLKSVRYKLIIYSYGMWGNSVENKLRKVLTKKGA